MKQRCTTTYGRPLCTAVSDLPTARTNFGHSPAATAEGWLKGHRQGQGSGRAKYVTATDRAEGEGSMSQRIFLCRQPLKPQRRASQEGSDDKNRRSSATDERRGGAGGADEDRDALASTCNLQHPLSIQCPRLESWTFALERAGEADEACKAKDVTTIISWWTPSSHRLLSGKRSHDDACKSISGETTPLRKGNMSTTAQTALVANER